jgi:predicted TIM-barrel fold metal-dependent hydrolase
VTGTGLVYGAWVDVENLDPPQIEPGGYDPAAKYPRLRCAVLEAGSNWITAWLDRMDHKAEVMHAFTPMKLLPSEYFKRQCLICAEPDESITAAVAEHLGEDYLLWASDYPHLDASFNVVAEIREKIAPLPESAQRKILGENAVRFYGLSV